MRYVIVGGGIAGTTAAEEIRKRDPDGEIVLVSEEMPPLYSRVLLPHYVIGKVPREKCFLKKETWYEEQKIEWSRGETAVRIDAKNKFVEISSAREIPYDKLLIATGGFPRDVPAEANGVSYLQTMDDADHLVNLLSMAARDVSIGAVYGGGFIACEYLNIFAHAGLPSICFHRGTHFWSHILDVESGRLISEHLAKNGVDVRPETLLSNVEEKDGRVLARTSSGDVLSDILGIGVGLERYLGWIERSGVKVEDGVRANAYLETSVEDVYAAGDVCEFDDVITGRATTAGNWTSAIMQGRVVAKTMTGERTPFRLVSSYATDVLGLDCIFIGDTRRDLATKIDVVGCVADGYIVQKFFDGNHLVGATLIGGNKDRAEITMEIDIGRKSC